MKKNHFLPYNELYLKFPYGVTLSSSFICGNGARVNTWGHAL